MVRNTMTMYTAYPHKISYCIENASKLLAMASVNTRLMETKVNASPFIVPKDRLLGEAAVI